METGMRKKITIEDPVYAEFRRVWEATGDDYMTRPMIASHFDRSSYWVQWMFVKTNCKPRTRSPKVRLREEGGVDDRLEYIDEMQHKSAAIAISKKIVRRSKELTLFFPGDVEFSRRFSNLRRIMATAEKRLERINELYPMWNRSCEIEKAIETGRNALLEASKLVRK